ncbi:MAG TPA: hypothetical protein VGW36_08520, partial [Pyrinomonadaceae bacterium]|nr:hypothetical protein [Pyrinomonadaceae bacterium]
MPETFQCPKCGAPVSYDNDVIGANLTARCSYCNSSLAVPGGVRPTHIKIQIGSGTSRGSWKWVWLLLILPLLGLGVIIAIAAFLIPWRSNSRETSKPVFLPTITSPTSPPKKEQPPSFATVLLQFGSEGIGPGMFKDARSIAVDGAGKIYVAEYIGGRVQVFDGEGKFLTQWMADPKMPLRGLAADRKGTVYVVQSGMIKKHEGETGKLLGEVSYAQGRGFDDV